MTPLETCRPGAHIALMVDSDEKPVMEPFPDKKGTKWHVIIRYHEGHERRIRGRASITPAGRAVLKPASADQSMWRRSSF